MVSAKTNLQRTDTFYKQIWLKHAFSAHTIYLTAGFCLKMYKMYPAVLSMCAVMTHDISTYVISENVINLVLCKESNFKVANKMHEIRS